MLSLGSGAGAIIDATTRGDRRAAPSPDTATATAGIGAAWSHAGTATDGFAPLTAKFAAEDGETDDADADDGETAERSKEDGDGNADGIATTERPPSEGDTAAVADVGTSAGEGFSGGEGGREEEDGG